MKSVSEWDILTAISDVAAAIGAIDSVADFVDSKPASVLRRQRGYLANTVEDMRKWLEEEDEDE